MKYKIWIRFISITLIILLTHNNLVRDKKPIQVNGSKVRRVLIPSNEKPKNIMKKKRLKEKNCKLFSTKWSVAGWNDNEIKYFHKHQVKCPKNHALKYFRLFTNNKRAKFQRGSHSMRFKYICCKIKTFDCETKVSKKIIGTNLYTLARIGKVNCPCEKVFSSFHIITRFDSFGKNPQTSVKYRCCSIYQKRLKTFKKGKKSTGFTDSGFGRNTFLDRHQINCGRSGFIRNFHALTKAKNKSGFNPYLKFKFSCLIPVLKKTGASKMLKKREKKKITINQKLETIKQLFDLGKNPTKSIFPIK
jgi:hypothetical protein